MLSFLEQIGTALRLFAGFDASVSAFAYILEVLRNKAEHLPGSGATQ